MKVHLYTLAWNEADILGFFFRHYDPWVDRYVVFDDGSTDETMALLEAHPRVEVRRFARTSASSFVESHQTLQNHVWKESRGRADWVVITALDEHLHLPNASIKKYLGGCQARGITYIPALGYQMISEDFPEPGEKLCNSRTWGAPFPIMSKLSIFAPDAIAETNFGVGRHAGVPVGRLKLPERDQLLLLHYKFLGFERTFRRLQFLQTGLGSTDIAHGWGIQYSWSLDKFRTEWEEFDRRKVDIARPDLHPWSSYDMQRWWRPPPAIAA